MFRAILVVSFLAAFSGCNTVEGFGRDLSGGANRVKGWIE